MLEIGIINPRDFTDDAHRTVDDYPFGGGAGMVLKPEPIFRAVESVTSGGIRVVLLSPKGERLTQEKVCEYSVLDGLVLICGRYKEVDERVRCALASEDLSVGDFVLAGGEAGALVVIESIARLLPGAVEHEESVSTDSFSPGSDILDPPWYTRPRVFRDMEVPEVLVSGDHAEVAHWRRERSLLLTASRRPELLRSQVLSEDERRILVHQLAKELTDGEEEKAIS